MDGNHLDRACICLIECPLSAVWLITGIIFFLGDQSPLQSPYQSPWVTDNVCCFGQSQFLLINRNIRDSQSQPLYRAINTSHRLSFVIDFPIAFSVGANTLDSALFFELFYSLCYRFSADSHFLRKLRHCVAGIFRKKR